jgi:hypothetical protein
MRQDEMHEVINYPRPKHIGASYPKLKI